MELMNKCGKAAILLSSLANKFGIFILRRKSPQKQTQSICILLPLLTLISATSALAATECNQSIADIYDSKSPAVVRITALTINPYRMEDRVQQTTGSGFVIDNQGLVMTNSNSH